MLVQPTKEPSPMLLACNVTFDLMCLFKQSFSHIIVRQVNRGRGGVMLPKAGAFNFRWRNHVLYLNFNELMSAHF